MALTHTLIPPPFFTGFLSERQHVRRDLDDSHARFLGVDLLFKQIELDWTNTRWVVRHLALLLYFHAILKPLSVAAFLVLAIFFGAFTKRFLYLVVAGVHAWASKILQGRSYTLPTAADRPNLVQSSKSSASGARFTVPGNNDMRQRLQSQATTQEPSISQQDNYQPLPASRRAFNIPNTFGVDLKLEDEIMQEMRALDFKRYIREDLPDPHKELDPDEADDMSQWGVLRRRLHQSRMRKVSLSRANS